MASSSDLARSVDECSSTEGLLLSQNHALHRKSWLISLSVPQCTNLVCEGAGPTRTQYCAMDDVSLSPMSLRSPTMDDGKRAKASPESRFFESHYIMHTVLKFFTLAEGCRMRRVNRMLNQVVQDRAEIHIKLDPDFPLEKARQYLCSTTKCYSR